MDSDTKDSLSTIIAFFLFLLSILLIIIFVGPHWYDITFNNSDIEKEEVINSSNGTILGWYIQPKDNLSFEDFKDLVNKTGVNIIFTMY